jgi:GNAT superfamily N-acetyltransferase
VRIIRRAQGNQTGELAMNAQTPGRKTSRVPALAFRPLTPARWEDFVELFGPHGATGGCWCMWPRLTSKEFESRKGAANRRAMRALVHAGHVPGILAYRGRSPVGWCALAPREEYVRLARSRVLAPVDDQPVWSVFCFFIARTARGQGVATALLRAAVAHACRKGGYPIEPRTGRFPDAFAYHGTASAFRAAGFREVARRSETRPIMRIEVKR